MLLHSAQWCLKLPLLQWQFLKKTPQPQLNLQDIETNKVNNLTVILLKNYRCQLQKEFPLGIFFVKGFISTISFLFRIFLHTKTLWKPTVWNTFSL